MRIAGQFHSSGFAIAFFTLSAKPVQPVFNRLNMLTVSNWRFLTMLESFAKLALAPCN